MFDKFFKTLKKKPLTEQITDKVIDSIILDREMFQKAKKSLRTNGNLELAKQVLIEDKIINKSERTIRRKLLTHFAIADKIDIGSGFTMSSIVIDIERIGDYAKNIADLALLLDGKYNCGPYNERVELVEKNIESMFEKTLNAFENSDADIAREVLFLYKNEISKECSLIKDALINEEEEMSSGNATAIALYLRSLKRIGAHLHNISTSILNPFPRIGYKEKK